MKNLILAVALVVFSLQQAFGAAVVNKTNFFPNVRVAGDLTANTASITNAVLVTPNLGAASATSLTISSNSTSHASLTGQAASTFAPLWNRGTITSSTIAGGGTNEDIFITPSGQGQVVFGPGYGLGFVPSVVNAGPLYGSDIGGISYRKPTEAMSKNFFLFRGGQYVFEDETTLWLVSITPTGVNIGSIADNTAVPMSKFEVSGNASIGSSYARTLAAPANSLIVQSQIGIGMSSPVSVLDVKALNQVSAGGIRLTSSTSTNRVAVIQDSFSGDRGYFNLLTGGVTTVVLDSGGSSGVGTSSPTSTFHVSGSFATAVITKTTNYTATISDSTILINGTTLTQTLPTAVGITGRIYRFALIANSTATIATTSSQNINGATTYALSAQYKSVAVQSDGTQWWAIENN